jgi:hypothetical protein
MQTIHPTPAKSAASYDQEQAIQVDVQAHFALSIRTTENAIQVLSNGWDGMSPEAQELFSQIFDPGDTGDFDDAYLAKVVANYEKILKRLQKDIQVEYVEEHQFCTLMRLYFTNYRVVYVCPYYLEEDSPARKARVLVHEIAHQALLVVDRPYYDPKSYSSQYNALSPQGTWVEEIPVVGHIVREIKHSDTLYHPDAYAWFASLVTP